MSNIHRCLGHTGVFPPLKVTERRCDYGYTVNSAPDDALIPNFGILPIPHNGIVELVCNEVLPEQALGPVQEKMEHVLKYVRCPMGDPLYYEILRVVTQMFNEMVLLQQLIHFNGEWIWGEAVEESVALEMILRDQETAVETLMRHMKGDAEKQAQELYEKHSIVKTSPADLDKYCGLEPEQPEKKTVTIHCIDCGVTMETAAVLAECKGQGQTYEARVTSGSYICAQCCKNEQYAKACCVSFELKKKS